MNLPGVLSRAPWGALGPGILVQTSIGIFKRRDAVPGRTTGSAGGAAITSMTCHKPTFHRSSWEQGMGNPLLLFGREPVAKSVVPTVRLLFDLLARWVSMWQSWTLLAGGVGREGFRRSDTHGLLYRPDHLQRACFPTGLWPQGPCCVAGFLTHHVAILCSSLRQTLHRVLRS